MRDRYAEFGRIDDERLVLVESNDPTLRQLSIKNPNQSDSIYSSVGRMPILDAGVYGVDGAEIGFRPAKNFRVGLFGGLIPQREPGRTFKVGRDNRQAGFYGTYQKRGREWFDHAYLTNALVAQESLEDPRIEQTTFEVPPIPQAVIDEELADDEQQRVSTTHWFHSGIVQPNEHLRITSLAYVYLTPKAFLRNGFLSATQHFNPKFSGSFGILRLDLKEYRRTRDVREKLAPSDYTQVKTELKHGIGKRLVILGGVLSGRRGIDGLKKSQIQAGFTVSQLAGNRLSTSVISGYRKNFISTDQFIKVGVDVYFRQFDVELDQQWINERKNNGEKLHPSITSLSFGLMLNEHLIMSFGGEYAKDERATISSALATISMRFSSRQLTPPRTQAPPAEHVGTEAL